MSDVSDCETLEILCPACEAAMSRTVAWLKKHDRITCRCGAVILLTPRTFDHEIAKANQAVDQLRRVIDKGPPR
jgi:hypothetical protein